MNGAELLVKTAVGAGIDVCFSNPGTTEMPLVQALDTVPGVRAYLGLFEGVCTGAADGYARMLGRPAMTLLHLGPGMANGISNLHNAKRAGSAIFNVIGEHATWHRASDPPLFMDIESLAGTVSGWHHTSTTAEGLSRDTAEGISASLEGKVSTLIVPQDHQWSDCKDTAIVKPIAGPPALETESLEDAVKLLKSGKKVAIILGGRALRKQGLIEAARIKTGTGCGLFVEGFPAHIERGAGIPDVPRLPYFPEAVIKALAEFEGLVFAGTRRPVAFFGYKGMASEVVQETQACVQIICDDRNITAALNHIAKEVRAPASPDKDLLGKLDRPPIPDDPLTGTLVSTVIAALQPEGAVIVDEANTSAGRYYPQSAGAPPSSLLTLTGGSLGQGLPCALGAAIACPDRPVISFQADGAAMYTVQALWTQARERLNVTTIICANRSYRILKVELKRAGVAEPGENAARLVNVAGIDWVGIGRGLGVPSSSVATSAELAFEFEKALAEDGPHLIEARL